MTETESVKSQWPDPIVEDFNDSDWPNLENDDSEVLKWVMTNKRILMRTVTWNLCAKPPPAKEELQKSLLISKFHLYVVGTEECERSIAQSAINPSKKNWEMYLAECFGSNYVPRRSHTLQAIHVVAFIHKAIAPLCTVSTSAAVPTGVGNTLGNKGGVGVFLKIGNTKLLVVNAHLTAHQNAVRQRNNDFFKINRNLPLLLDKKDTIKEANKGSTSDIVTQKLDKPTTTNITRESTVPLETSPTNKDSIVENKPPSITDPQAVPQTLPPTMEEMIRNSHDETTILENGVVNDNIVKDEDSESGPDDQSPRYSKVSIGNDSSNDLSALVGGKGIKQYADIVIFMGDLNYRIKGNRAIINRLLENNMHEVLLHNDQLRTTMTANEVFQGFTEPPLNFKPTYKYDIGTDIYDSSSKQRIPSWTDRILYVPSPDIQCIAYNCDNSISTSDHKPVYASFMIHLQLFVTLDANENAIVPYDLSPKFTSESQVCTIM